MGKQDVIEIDGVVTDTLPNAMFKVNCQMDTKYWLTFLVKSVCTTSAFYQGIVSPLKSRHMI